jgi:hypothetical protein
MKASLSVNLLAPIHKVSQERKGADMAESVLFKISFFAIVQNRSFEESPLGA